MRTHSLSILLTFLMLPFFGNTQELDLQKQRLQSESEAERAISALRQLFITTTEADFSKSDQIGEKLKLGSLVVPKETVKIDALNRKIQIWISQIDLAQDYPATKFSGQETVNQLIRGKDYYGVSISSDFAAFDQRHQLVKRLFDDPKLHMGDRLFGLMQTGKEDPKATVRKWISFMQLLSGPDYFGTSFDKQPTTLYRSLKGITVLRGVVNCQKFQDAIEASGLKAEYERVLNDQLKVAAFNFAKSRYRDGGLLRDWSLPVAETIISMFPGENRDSIGITTQSEYHKYTLAHARALTELIEHFNAKSWSGDFVNRSLSSINTYRTKPFYIGSTEIRENGTLKVPQDQELELLLANAALFGSDGHINIDRYNKHSERLDKIFTGQKGKANFEGLLALKNSKQWVDFFQYEFFDDRKNKDSVFRAIRTNHAISSRGMKLMFLARLILPSESLQASIPEGSVLEKEYEDLLNRLEVEVKRSSAQEYRNFSDTWSRVQNGYMELAKGFTIYSFDRLNLTTSSKLEVVRRGFDKAMGGNESVPSLLQKLFTPNSKYLASSMEQMTSPDFRSRVGRFDMKITPEFVDVLNERLIDIIDYRTYGYAAIDSLERPDSQPGKIMSHFRVSDYRLPDSEQSNTVMHDLICGPDGGFGGLGALFVPNIEAYQKQESALDGIAAAENLKLGDVLFSLALDVKREPDYTNEELGRAAKRWLAYFKQSQSSAQFNPTPDILKQAVRGNYLTRLVFQSDSFQRAMENSSTAPIGSGADISHQFESVVSAQVDRMQGMLSRIDPETASNRNIDETKTGWFEVKVWYIESVKWLETILDDPMMASELARIQHLNRTVVEYHKLAAEVVIFQKDLLHFGGEIYSEPEIPFTAGIAKFGIDEVIKLEEDLEAPLKKNEIPEEKFSAQQEEFGRAVSRQFLNEIRAIVRDHGFKELSQVSNQTELDAAFQKAIAKEAEANFDETSDLTDRAKAIESAYEAAIAKAISRIEAEQPSEMRDLYYQMVRAAKVDKFISKDLSFQQRLEIDPSLILGRWVETNRVETLANFRTREISAEARQMVNRARAEKDSMEDVRRQLESARDRSALKMDILNEWVNDSDQQVSVDEMMEDYLSMKKELSDLKKQNMLLADSEAIVRAHSAGFAQQIMQYKNGDKLAAAAAQTQYSQPDSTSSYTPPASSYKPPASSYKPPSKPKPQQNYNRNQQPAASNRTFFQRLFKRQQR